MNGCELTFELLPHRYAVCQLKPAAPLPQWALQGEFYAITRSVEELSVVTAEANLPAAVDAERDWRILKIAAVLDFSMVGVLAAISGLLAAEAISIFVISTYNTDYLLVKQALLAKTVAVLRRAGHEVN